MTITTSDQIVCETPRENETCCPDCGGEGIIRDDHSCETCHGSGTIHITPVITPKPKTQKKRMIECSWCGFVGKSQATKQCPKCHSKGTFSDTTKTTLVESQPDKTVEGVVLWSSREKVENEWNFGATWDNVYFMEVETEGGESYKTKVLCSHEENSRMRYHLTPINPKAGKGDKVKFTASSIRGEWVTSHDLKVVVDKTQEREQTREQEKQDWIAKQKAEQKAHCKDCPHADTRTSKAGNEYIWCKKHMNPNFKVIIRVGEELFCGQS